MPPLNPIPLLISLLLYTASIPTASAFGSTGPISAAYGRDSSSFFCAIDAGGQQGAVCWSKNDTTASETPGNFTSVPPMATLSGGVGFMCGILANTSQAYCWDSSGSGTNLVPQAFRSNSYFSIASGSNHACAIRGSYYTADDNSGSVDCWDVVRRPGTGAGGDGFFTSENSSRFYDQKLGNLMFKNLVAGDGFSCGSVIDGAGLYCWGPNSNSILGISETSDNFISMASGTRSLCGITEGSKDIKCWGDHVTFKDLPSGSVKLISMAAGDEHYCGIREDTHGIQCWGRFNSSAVPKNSGFSAIASADYVTCGIREEDLVLSCWFYNTSYSPPAFIPPMQLCSPGVCTPSPCNSGEFTFNASTLGEPDLTTICARKDLIICSPCASNCSEGYFLSTPCTSHADRICTPCSLCQNSSCWGVCGMEDAEMKKKHKQQIRKFILILGPSTAGFLLIVIGWCFFPYIFFFKSKDGPKKQFKSCIGYKPDLESNQKPDSVPSLLAVAPCPGEAQIFRLSELKDATNGFKEFNELGRGSYGFVYKAVLADGRQVAVKRANAATIIHTNIREFETELEILCKLRHSNIINLLGYCTEMGERLLVYEYMTHGTLHDHLHGGLSPLNWLLRLKIATQASMGLEYLHREGIVHREFKTSNVLLDSDWCARVTDFGWSSGNDERDVGEYMKGDVYDFGVVLLEILSGRKAWDVDYTPASIVEWAVPLIRRGRGAAIIDRYVALPRNVEPLLKLADVAELAVREDLEGRPSMAELAISLEHIWKGGLIL